MSVNPTKKAYILETNKTSCVQSQNILGKEFWKTVPTKWYNVLYINSKIYIL